MLVPFEQFDNFKDALQFSPDSVTPELINAVKQLDEREEFEPFIRSILNDSNVTAHGPAEIVDVLTHKLTLQQHTGLAAFILKGKSLG